MEQAQAGPPVP